MDHKAFCITAGNGKPATGSLLSYNQVEEGKQSIPGSESIVCGMFKGRICGTRGGYGSYYTKRYMHGSLGLEELAGSM